MDKQSNIHDEFNFQEDDFLKGLPKANPFSVPENYFEDFAHAMQYKIAEQSKAKSYGFPLLPRWVPGLALIAVFVAVFWIIQSPKQVVVTQAPTPLNTNTEQPVKASLSDARNIDEFVDFDEDMLENELASQKKNELSSHEKQLENYVIDQYSESQIIEEL
jgi:hypothetical protein